MIIRYRWDGGLTDEEIDANIPQGLSSSITAVGPSVFVDIELLPDPISAAAHSDIDEFMASIGWVFVADDPTTPTNSIGQLISVYDSSGGQNFTGTITVDFDTVSKVTASGLYTLNAGGTIDVLEAGSYEISYDASFDLGAGNTRTSSRTQLSNNGTLIPGTYGFGYHRNAASGEDTATATITLDLAANDTISVVSQRLSGPSTLTTIAQGSRLTIKRVG